MTEENARMILGIRAVAGTMEIEQAYERLKPQLEESLGRAPTPSLQAKYRQRLREMEEAFCFLQGSSSGAEIASMVNLPYLRKTGIEEPVAFQATPEVVLNVPIQSPVPSTGTGKGALVIALVLLLAGGGMAGWWLGIEQPRRVAERVAAVEKQKNMEAAKGVENATSKAKELFEKVAAQGKDFGQYSSGVKYLEGEGVEKDFEKAKELFENANDQTLVPWRFGLAKDFEKSKVPFKNAAAMGNAVAQFNLGVMYQHGFMVERDTAKAKELFEKAAAQGNADAQIALGITYYDGNGVKKDLAKAKELFEKAAAQGNVVAQTLLGIMYQYGEGVERDTAKAKELYEKAAAMGNVVAQNNLGAMYQHPPPLKPTAEEARQKRKKEELAKGVARATKEDPWENSLGMKFVPVPGTTVLFSIWDTRVQDFRQYARATGYAQSGAMFVMKVEQHKDGIAGILTEELDKEAGWENPGFHQGEDHPVVGVNWDEAKAFCAWLTEKERKAERIGSGQEYRLPTDEEWSAAVGESKYPWGNQWPPPEGAGNYFDDAAVAKLPGKGWSQVPGNDGYARTSPVGSFRANRLGLYDMGGNVWQWCEDWYRSEMNERAVLNRIPSLKNDGGGQLFRVVRGASWKTDFPENLLSSIRFDFTPSFRHGDFGFRCVLVSGSSSR